jgi:PAS domain-containing protein
MKHTNKKASFLTLTPLRIVMLYAVVGVFWILFSDYLLKVFVHDPATMVKIAMMKGAAYVAATAVLLYFLIRRFEKAYLASEQQYRSLMEQASDSIAIFNLNGDLLAVNTSACEMLGYGEAEMLRLNVKDIFLLEN